MEHAYWGGIWVIEMIVFFCGIKWARRAAVASHASLQPGAAFIYALSVAAAMIVVAILAYFVAFELLGFKIPIVRRL